jgi:hypothetical protein
MRVDKISVTGSFRGALLRAAYSRQLAGLQSGTRTAADEDACTTTADDHRQSAMIRRNGRRVTTWCDAARRSHHPEMLKFATEMLATRLPTEATVLVRRQHSDNDGRGGSCKLCGAEEETVVHAMGHCAARWPAAARASSVQHAVQLLREWGVACVPTGPTAPDRAPDQTGHGPPDQGHPQPPTWPSSPAHPRARSPLSEGHPVRSEP